MKRSLAGLVLLSLIFTACTALQSAAEPGPAESTLINFFQALSAGDYEEAVGLYGGSYQQLRAMNPQSDPNDLASLWQAGCEVNGLVCLPVGQVIESANISEHETLITVDFEKDDGVVFSLGPCCGANDPETAPLTFFKYRVLDQDGACLVLDMPVLLP